jgi:hypothetical protein
LQFRDDGGLPRPSATMDGVRLSEFWVRMERRLGAGYARSWAAAQLVQHVVGRTVVQALEQGEDAKTVWRAVAEATDAPPAER